MIRFRWLALGLTLLVSGAALAMPDAEAQSTGRRIWKNECGGRVDGLTSWNSGEDFASLGIGHFIWYHQGQRGPFQESFPALLEYLRAHRVALPVWLAEARACPWTSREAFLADFQGNRLRELRALLANTVADQARFIAERMLASLPRLLAVLPEQQRPEVRRRFEQVAAAPGGTYALMDYVNFKGEGINPSERYAGQGWGLLQVLQESGSGSLTGFATAADRVLTRRVQNSPPQRHEAQWLPGWRNRVRTYARP